MGRPCLLGHDTGALLIWELILQISAMSCLRRLAARLLRPALAGLGLVVLAAGPSVAAAQQDHDEHCATVSQEPSPSHASQLIVASTVGPSHAPCDECPDRSCDGRSHCVAGGIVPMETVTLSVAAPVPATRMQQRPSGLVLPSYDPTPPTPPPNASSVR